MGWDNELYLQRTNVKGGMVCVKGGMVCVVYYESYVKLRISYIFVCAKKVKNTGNKTKQKTIKYWETKVTFKGQEFCSRAKSPVSLDKHPALCSSAVT